MKIVYFLIFLIILIGIAGGYVYFSARYFDILSKAQLANLQADILAVKDYAIKNQTSGKEPVTLIFVGDIMLGRGVEKVWRKYDNTRYPFLRIVDEIRNAAIAFANLEGPISSRGESHKIKYAFRFDPQVIEGLNFAGFDVLSLANNHIMDYGREALEDTISVLKENNIEPIGAGKNYLEANNPLIKEVGGVKIAFMAYELLNQGANWLKATKDNAGRSSFELERIKNEIQSMKELSIADIIIVSFHWGEEYQTRSNKSQQEIGRALAEAGADLIIGHHPHVVQELERYKNSWIAYSLGNFVFDQNFSQDTMRGLILKVKIQNKKISEVEPIEIKINNSFQPEAVY